MVFQPGQSGNPGGQFNNGGPRRHRHTLEVIREINRRGHQDPLITLSEIQHNPEYDLGTRANAATSLAPFVHPKMQSVPTPRYLEEPIDIPEFTTVDQATQFIAKIDHLTAAGKLDLGAATELTAITKAFIDSEISSELEARVAALEFHVTHPDEPPPGEPEPTT
jgi:hypothetical protein